MVTREAQAECGQTLFEHNMVLENVPNIGPDYQQNIWGFNIKQLSVNMQQNHTHKLDISFFSSCLDVKGSKCICYKE